MELYQHNSTTDAFYKLEPIITDTTLAIRNFARGLYRAMSTTDRRIARGLYRAMSTTDRRIARRWVRELGGHIITIREKPTRYYWRMKGDSL